MTSNAQHPAAWVPARPTINPGPRTLDVDTIRFSQSTVSGPTRVQDIEVTLAELVEIYRHQGYISDPIAVVEMPDGKLTSLDNRRLWAAQQAGLTEIPVIVHDRDEPWGNEAQRGSVYSKKKLIDRDGEFGQAGQVLMAAFQTPDTHLFAALRRCAKQRGHGGKRFPLAGSLVPPRFTREKHPTSRTPEEDRIIRLWMSHTKTSAASSESVSQTPAKDTSGPRDGRPGHHWRTRGPGGPEK